MVVIFDSNEAERLEHSIRYLAHGTEDLSHAVHGARLRLKGDFDKIALRQRLGQLQQAACDGNALEFGFRAASVFQTNGSQNRVSELDPGRAPRRVRLGEVGHRSKTV